MLYLCLVQDEVYRYNHLPAVVDKFRRRRESPLSITSLR